MITTEISEDGDLQAHRIHPMLIECMRGHLERDMPRGLGFEGRQLALHTHGVGGGQT